MACLTAPQGKVILALAFLAGFTSSAIALDAAEVFEVQARLNHLGFDAGKPDGRAGPNTRRAARSFASDAGVEPALAPALLNALRTASGIAPLQHQPACEEGYYRFAFFGAHVQLTRLHGRSLDRARVEADREGADWAEVTCLDETRISAVATYRFGEPQDVWRYSYSDGRPWPVRIEVADDEGLVTTVIDFERDADGMLTHAVIYDRSGELTHKLFFLDDTDGYRWTILWPDGTFYTELSVRHLDTGFAAEQRQRFEDGDELIYIYGYDPATLHPIRFSLVRNGLKIHDGDYENDYYGRITEQRITLMGDEGGTFYNRWFDRGNLVKEERDDAEGVVGRHEYEWADDRLVGQAYYRDEILTFTMEYVYEDGRIEESRLYLPDGRHYATYFGREQRYVSQDGTPEVETGPFERHLEGNIWPRSFEAADEGPGLNGMPTGTWTATSRTASAITGDITLRGSELIFGDGTVLPLTFVAEQQSMWTPGVMSSGKIFRVDPPQDPVLLHGNTLCGQPVTYIVLTERSPGSLALAVFSGASPPSGFGDNSCAAYFYER